MNKSIPQNGIKDMPNLQSPKETLRSKLLRLRPGDTITLTAEEAEIYGVDVAVARAIPLGRGHKEVGYISRRISSNLARSQRNQSGTCFPFLV